MRADSFLAVVCALAITMVVGETQAQEHGFASGAEEQEYHLNHGAGFLGASTHLDEDDTGFTIGLEYARRLSRMWAIGGAVEMASSRIERNIVLGVPVILYPWRGLALVAMPGAEIVSAEVEHGDGSEEETELEFLGRLGLAYWFEVNEALSVAPAFYADVAGGRCTLVYGVLLGVGF